MVNYKRVAVGAVLAWSLLLNFGFGYIVKTWSDAKEQTYTLSKTDWVCAIEYIPNDKPEDKFCVVYAMKVEAIE